MINSKLFVMLIALIVYGGPVALVLLVCIEVIKWLNKIFLAVIRHYNKVD
jgi:hypothetical protein